MPIDEGRFSLMAHQAEQMRGGITSQVEEMFPNDGPPNLFVTGFVFRPAVADDLEEGEGDPDDDLYVFEAFFYAEDHPTVGNINSKLYLHFKGCTSYEDATRQLQEGIRGNV